MKIWLCGSHGAQLQQQKMWVWMSMAWPGHGLGPFRGHFLLLLRDSSALQMLIIWFQDRHHVCPVWWGISSLHPFFSLLLMTFHLHLPAQSTRVEHTAQMSEQAVTVSKSNSVQSGVFPGVPVSELKFTSGCCRMAELSRVQIINTTKFQTGEPLMFFPPMGRQQSSYRKNTCMCCRHMVNIKQKVKHS